MSFANEQLVIRYDMSSIIIIIFEHGTSSILDGAKANPTY